VIIEYSEEFTRDWDWYAVDQDGYVGHFTSAGMRTLPKSVKSDREATQLVAKYFFEQAPVRGDWSLRAGVEKDCGGWEKQGFDRYVRDFALMATKGLFSFNTELIHGEGRYYLVAIPARRLRVDDLPINIKEILLHTIASLRLENCAYINGPTTESW
jgi:hypothetical protein